jgi:hypothetical protein
MTKRNSARVWLTVDELAERWHVTPGAIHQRRCRGDMPPGMRVGRRVLWRLDVVEQFEDSFTEQPNPAA